MRWVRAGEASYRKGETTIDLFWSRPLGLQIWHKNSIQLYGFLIFNGAAFCYALFQYFQLKDMYENQTWGPSLEVDREVLRSYGNILIVLPVIIGVFEVAYVYLVYKLVKEFGWRMYKRIGADPHMRCEERGVGACSRNRSTCFWNRD